ncbi:hypothetical protein P4V47_17590 [Brevibacillus laterosporus]|uniref:hypothetical protein n=1 Tax=Brevibacillus laterosporus TaxID=1465 RepID=UPI002E1A1195|nr:hypothetical protein [Brevibacillus laterosporus]
MSGAWLKTRSWFPNDYIPLAIVVMAVAYNAINALLFGGDLLEAGKMAFIEATAAIGIHSGVKIRFRREMWSNADDTGFCSSREKEPSRT